MIWFGRSLPIWFEELTGNSQLTIVKLPGGETALAYHVKDGVTDDHTGHHMINKTNKMESVITVYR